MIGGQLEQLLNRESFQSFESFRNHMLAKMGKDKGSGRANRPSRADEAGSPQHPSSTDTDMASKFCLIIFKNIFSNQIRVFFNIAE
jgi:hypothetical protein